MVANTRDRAKRIHELELSCLENKRKTDNICRDEEVRLAKVDMLALKDAIEDLKNKLVDKDDHSSDLSASLDKVSAELEESKHTVRAQETRIKKQDMEINNLQLEVNALNETVQDSGKAVQEKFALTRELNRIRPELEHVQSQLTNYKEVVSERNELRRQLHSLEVELENEKKSRQSIQAKADDAVVSELKTQLEEAEKKVAAEQKEREKAKREHERELGEVQATSERLEERLETLKNKYKATHAELKETRAQLEESQAELQKASKSSLRPAGKEATKKSVTIEPGPNRKRRAQDMSFEDITVQTPGAEMPSKKAVGKRLGIDPAALGEKSTFSITPFLNRGRNLADDSTCEAGNDTFQGAHSPLGKEDEAAAGETKPKTKVRNVRAKAGQGEAGDELGTGDHDADELEAEPVEPSMQEVEPEAKEPEVAPPRKRGRPKKALADTSSAQANKSLPKRATKAMTKRQAALNKVDEAPAADEQENVVLESRDEATDATARKVSSKEEAANATARQRSSKEEATKATARQSSSKEEADDATARQSSSMEEATNASARQIFSKAPALQPKMLEVGEVKRKKRKLLGGAANRSLTAVGEEDEDADADADAAAGAVPDVVAKRPMLAAPVGRRGKGQLQLGGAGVRNAFGGAAFSPLKKDRRGANKSFLA